MASIGFMYVGKRPCGRVAAACWDDPKYAKDMANTVADWINRGFVVERLERHEGDEQPQWMCNECRSKPCKEA